MYIEIKCTHSLILVYWLSLCKYRFHFEHKQEVTKNLYLMMCVFHSSVAFYSFLGDLGQSCACIDTHRQLKILMTGMIVFISVLRQQKVTVPHKKQDSKGAKCFRYRVSIHHPLGFNWHPKVLVGGDFTPSLSLHHSKSPRRLWVSRNRLGDGSWGVMVMPKCWYQWYLRDDFVFFC